MILTAAIILMASCIAPSSLNAESLSYATFGNMVLQSEPALKHGPLIASRWEQESEGREQSFQFELPEIPLLSLVERKKLAFLLLHTFCEEEFPVQKSLLQESEIEALALISKQSEGQRCLLDIFPTKTVFGQAITAKKLAMPTNVRADIEKNQLVIKELSLNPKLYQGIKEAIETLALYETSLLSMFASSHGFNKKVFKEFYYHNAEYNKSIRMLALLRAYQTFFTEPRFAVPRVGLKSALDEIFMRLSHFANNKFFGMTITQTTQGEWTLRAASVALFAMQDFVFNYLFNKSKRDAQEAAFIQMRASLMLMIGWIEQLKMLSRMIDSSSILQEPLADLSQEISLLLNGYYEEECKQLLEILASGTFHGKSSSYFDSARVLAAYKLLDAHKDKLVPLFGAIGNLDSLCAAAEAYLLSQEHANHFCFADFDEGAQPTIMLDELWNPLMNADSAIANTVYLGQPMRTMIITGPNGSGKSIFMKSVALNLVLAQSFGIAASRSAKISLFDKFHIYLNIQENLELSLSTFMAEKKKMDDICKQVATQPAGCKSFTLIDEGLKGTVEQSGGPHMYQAGLTMGNNPGNICLLATHFKKPTELERDIPETFANYHLGLLEPTEGSFIRTFTLEKGKNDWWFTNDDKRERFIAWLTT